MQIYINAISLVTTMFYKTKLIRKRNQIFILFDIIVDIVILLRY